MSTKINPLVLVAALSLGVTVSVSAGPVCEGLLNDQKVYGVGLAQVDDFGRCIMIVNLSADENAPVNRAVASASGDVKLFTGLDAAASTIKRMALDIDAEVTYKRRQKTGTLGDPVATLKSNYRSFKAEKIVTEKQAALIAAKISAATALGWHTAVGTPEAVEYADYVARNVSVAEWGTYCAAKVAALAASLTAAGVDPMTVV